MGERVHGGTGQRCHRSEYVCVQSREAAQIQIADQTIIQLEVIDMQAFEAGSKKVYPFDIKRKSAELLYGVVCKMNVCFIQKVVSAYKLIKQQMSEHDEIDPYLEYQQILAKAQEHELDNIHPVPVQTNNQLPQIQQPQKQIDLAPKRVISFSPPKALPNLIAPHLHDRQVDSTVKRPITQYLSPQHCTKLEATKYQMRMKIILENNRLKGSIEALRSDLNQQRANEIKIAQILKESKDKLSHFKQLVKEKSKKVCELSQSNIELRGTITELQQKINHLNCYSIWQEGQISDLKRQLQQKCDQRIEEHVLHDKIQKLQGILKSYQTQVIRYEEQMSNTFSRSHQEGEIASQEHLQERPSEHWGTINELELKDIENIKHRDSNHDQQYDLLAENNSVLRQRVQQLEKQMEKLRTDFKGREEQWVRQKQQNLLKLESLQEQINAILLRSNDKDSKIQEREQSKLMLEQEIQRLNCELKESQQQCGAIKEKYVESIQELNRLIQAKQQCILQLQHRLQDKDGNHKKEIAVLQIAIQQNEERFASQWQQMKQKLEEVNKKNVELQNMREDDRIRLELEKALREEHQQREKEAREFLGIKSQIEEELAYYKEQYSRIQHDHSSLLGRFDIAQQTVRILEDEKSQLESELDKYAKDIDQFKIVLARLSKTQNGQEKLQPQRVIEEQEEESEDSLPESDSKVTNTDRSHFPRNQERMNLKSEPLEEQQQLSEPGSEVSRSSEKSFSRSYLLREIETLKRQNAQLQRRYSDQIEQLKQKFKLELIEVHYQYEQEKQNSQSEQKVQKLTRSVKLMQNELGGKNQLLDQKDHQLHQLQEQINSIQSFYQEQTNKLKAFISNQTMQLKNKHEALIGLELTAQKLKHDNQQLMSRLNKLQEENSTFHREKLRLLESKADLQNQFQKMAYEHELESSNKSLLYTKQIEHLKNQLQEEIGQRYKQESKLYLSQQITQKQKEIEIQSKQKVHTLQLKIIEVKNSLDMITASHELTLNQNNHLKERKNSLEEAYNHLKTQFQSQEEHIAQLKLKAQEIQQLQDKIETQNSIKKELQLQIQRLQSQNSVLQCELESHQAQLQTTKSKIKLVQDQLDERNSQKQKEVQEYKEKLQTFQNIIDEQKSYIDRIHVEKQSIIHSNLKQGQDFTQLNSRATILKTQNEAMALEIEELKDLVSKCNQEIEKIKIQNNKMIGKLNAACTEAEALDRQKKQVEDLYRKVLQCQIDNRAKIQEQDVNIMNMRASLELSQSSHTAQVQTLMSSVAKQKQELSSKLQELQKLKQIIQELKSELADVHMEKQGIVDQYESKLKESAKQIEELILKNCQSCAKIQQLNQSIFSFSETVKFKEEQLQQQHKSLTDIEALFKNKKAQSEVHSSKIEQLQQALLTQARQFSDYRQAAQKQKKQVGQELQIVRKLMQESQQQNELKIIKINKEMTTYKLLLEQAQLESSQRLEESSRSITNMKSQIKLSHQLIKQRDQSIKQLKEQISTFKEQTQRSKLVASTFEQEKAQLQQSKVEHQIKARLMEDQLTCLKKQLHRLQITYEQVQAEKVLTTLEISSLKSNLRQYQMTLSQFKVEREKILADKQKIVAEKERALAEKQRIEAERLRIHAQNERISKEKQRIEFEFQKISNERDSLKQEVNNLKQNLQVSIQQLKNTQSQVQQFQIENKKMQYKSEMMEQGLKKVKEQLRMIEEEKQKQAESLFRSKRKIDDLEQDKEQLNQMLTSIEKQHSIKLENLRQQQRDHYLQMERKYTKQVEELFQQMSKLRAEKDHYKLEIDKNKKQGSELRDKIDILKKESKIAEERLKEYQEEREELSDKIVQLSQQNNEMTEVVETLRNDLMSKNDQIYQLKDQLEKLAQQLNKVGASDSNKSIPLSIEEDRTGLQEMVQKLQAINRQLIAKNEIIQSQLNEKIKAERDLMQKYDRIKQKDTRDRNNSSDSWISRNKPFADEKSQNLEKQIEYYKLQLESAEAYIAQLQHENKENCQSQILAQQKALQQKLKDLQKQNQDLKIKVDYQEAYIDHLQADNIKASIISKRSAVSKKPGIHLQVDRDHSVISQDNSHQIEKSGESNRQILNKINMINEFIENYKKDNVSIEKEEEFRKTLNNPYLDELLNTIFYALQKQSNNLRQKEHEIAELEMENEQFQQEIKSLQEIIQRLSLKIELNDQVEKKYEETKKMLQETLMFKLKQEASLAENKRYIEELQRRNIHQDRSKHQKMLSHSSRSQKRDKEDLSILKEANEDEESQSVMSADIDSQIPSELQNSRDIKASNQFPLRKAGSQRLPINKLVSIECHLSQDAKNGYMDFLHRLLDEIDKIENQVAYIQLDLQEKGDVLAELLAQNNKSMIVRNLQEIESKVSQNDREMRYHMQKSESELIGLIRQILRYRQAQDQYGLQTENRLKIQECLSILEKQLQKSSRINEEDKCEEIKLFNNSNRLKVSLNTVREDASNEDKGSSILNPKHQGFHSRLKSQGNPEAQQIADLKKQYAELTKQLNKVSEQLLRKEEAFRKINDVVVLVTKEIGGVFDDILMNCEQNQYLMEQLDGVKRYLGFVLSEKSLLSMLERNPSAERLNESGRMMLADSKKKLLENDKRKHVNYFQELLRLSNNQFIQLGQELTNQHVKALQRRLEEMVQYRYEDCIDFLLCEESLILSILKIGEEESANSQTMEKLASKFTKQEMANIIQNCHNQAEARKILNRVLTEEADKSQSQQNDFSPDPEKLQAIRERIYPYPTELCLSLHNKLLSILTAPTRQVFYQVIEQFYRVMKQFEDRIKEEVDERDSRSEASSMRMKQILEDPVIDDNYQEMEKFKLLEFKNLKERSGSCRVSGSEAHGE